MDLSLKQLEEAVGLRRQIDALEGRLTSLLRGNGMSSSKVSSSAGAKTDGRRRKMSAATRAKIAAAARARWAKVRGSGAAKSPAKKTGARKRGRMSPAARKRLSEMMKARWAARRKGQK